MKQITELPVELVQGEFVWVKAVEGVGKCFPKVLNHEVGAG